VVGPGYTDYGHNPPGRGPQGAKDDYGHAVKMAGGAITYDIDALVSRGDTVAAAWTGHLPNGQTFRGLSLYLVTDGKLAETRHAWASRVRVLLLSPAASFITATGLLVDGGFCAWRKAIRRWRRTQDA